MPADVKPKMNSSVKQASETLFSQYTRLQSWLVVEAASMVVPRSCAVGHTSDSLCSGLHNCYQLLHASTCLHMLV